MKKALLLLVLTGAIYSGCTTIYIVRHATVDEILAEGQDAQLKRYRIEGYAVYAFEHRALYGSLEEARDPKTKKAIWLRSGISSSVDPFGRTREITKVKIEGTIWMNPPLPVGTIPPDWDPIEHGLGVGHMGAFQAELVDVIVIDRTSISKEVKTEPDGTGQPM